jgi:membrane protein involved in colicin uptake
MGDDPDRQAQRSRADAIRRKRDNYNTTPSEGEGTPSAAPDGAPADDTGDGAARGPNYAAWIQKKMREKKQGK